MYVCLYYCNCTVLYCIVLYCIVLLYGIELYCTGLYCIVLYCTALFCSVLYCTVLYCIDIGIGIGIVLYCIVLCVVLCCGVVCCGVLCCVVWYGMVIWYGMLWYGMAWYGMYAHICIYIYTNMWLEWVAKPTDNIGGPFGSTQWHVVTAEASQPRKTWCSINEPWTQCTLVVQQSRDVQGWCLSYSASWNTMQVDRVACQVKGRIAVMESGECCANLVV